MAKGKPAARKETLKSMKIVDGQRHAVPDVDSNIRTIDEIMGVTTSGPFKANSLAEFETQIADMNLADMQALATRIGLLPVHDRVVLKQRLLGEYKKDRVKKMPYDISSAVGPGQGLKQDVSDRAKRILNEGR